ncbi:40S ribosomal protein S10 [Raphidocelis subcapitata]|uniref:40S ribosomal protein S10 n=1 Tax=Raphidocelis subcapitata TaxID=307507 RepID=A0A2V0P4F1_9CHLO|nr:40S ribosomal protein S10 [Raphidocelis subcapitata]|eukprot:GBF92733.1 40S ribosomal protein S10 [Raphidocelis subcapitata]
MLIPKKNRREVYKFLFKEGVLYAEKDFNLEKHPEVEVPNLQVIKLMQSFKSKELVTERFAWRHYYWFLTNKGIEYLREYLNLPADVVPATLKKSARPIGERPRPPMGDRPSRGPPRDGYGGREGYRSERPREGGFGRGGGGDDKAGAPGAYRPQFGGGGGGGGFGRGSA